MCRNLIHKQILQKTKSNWGAENSANLFLHGTSEHADTLHVDGSLDALLELLVLASLPTHPDEASAAGQYNEQGSHADAHHSPQWNYTQRQHGQLVNTQ